MLFEIFSKKISNYIFFPLLAHCAGGGGWDIMNKSKVLLFKQFRAAGYTTTMYIVSSSNNNKRNHIKENIFCVCFLGTSCTIV